MGSSNDGLRRGRGKPRDGTFKNLRMDRQETLLGALLRRSHLDESPR